MFVISCNSVAPASLDRPFALIWCHMSKESLHYFCPDCIFNNQMPNAIAYFK